MFRIPSHFLAAFLAICIGTGLAAAQSTSSTGTSSVTIIPVSPAAYVYVSSGHSGETTGHIYGYVAVQDGELTPIPGTPLASSLVGPLALNGKWLFGGVNLGGADEAGKYAIDSYRIAANGSIAPADTYTATAPDSEEPQYLFMDHTGTSLYASMTTSNEDQGFRSFRIDQTNGKITPVSYLATGVGENGVLAFIGNNKFGYNASCFHFSRDIGRFARESDGALSSPGIGPLPPAGPPHYAYCPDATAADPSNHVVISMEQMPEDGGTFDGFKLAVYTANEDNGDLSTTSTYKNMATSQVKPDVLAMSTGGAFLAAAGGVYTGPGHGLQVFRMHGAEPLTAFSGVLIPGVDAIGLFWDKYDHLYLLGTDKLYVFSVTESGVKQAPGSPYSIPYPTGLVVLPK